MIIHTAHLK